MSDTLTEREKELVEKIAGLEQDKANLVNEIKDERTKKQEREAALEAAKSELEKVKSAQTKPEDSVDPEVLVEKVLRRKEEESSKNAMYEAKMAMKTLYNEFSDASDAGGILFNKFETELAKFNLSGLKTKEDYLNRFKEVYEFMGRKSKPAGESSSFYNGQRQDGSTPPKVEDVNLSGSEVKLMQELGWDKDRYLKAKAKRPQYIATLLSYRK